MIGKAEVDPVVIEQPDSGWMARERQSKHVDVLAESFQKTGTYNTSIVVVVVDNDWSLQIENRSDQTSNMSSAEILERFQDSSSSMQVISGNHSVAGVVALQNTYPSNTIWKKIAVHVLVCSDSDEDLRQVRILGNETNTTNAYTLKQDYPDVIMQMHNRLVLIQNDEDLTPVKKAAAIKGLKGDVATSCSISANSVGAHFQVAKQEGDVWELVEQCLRGGFPINEDAVGKRPTPSRKGKKKASQESTSQRMTSGRNFTQLTSLPTVTKTHVLTKVVSGEWTQDWMFRQCGLIKARIRLRNHIVGFFEMRGVDEEFDTEDAEEGEEGQTPTWQGFELQFPWLEEFVPVWTSAVFQTKVTEDMPTDLNSALDEKLTKSLQDQVSRHY